jgi:copper(I)-binding protein
MTVIFAVWAGTGKQRHGQGAAAASWHPAAANRRNPKAPANGSLCALSFSPQGIPMKRMLCALALSLFAHLAAAQDIHLGALTVSHPWALSTPPMVQEGVAYLEISNHGAEADRLLAITVTPAIAGEVQMHRSSEDQGIMRMRPVTGGLVVAAGSTLVFAPGKLKLRFARAGDAEVSVEVRDAPQEQGGMDGMDMKMKM